MPLPILILACLAYILYAIAIISQETKSQKSNPADSMHPAIKCLFCGGVPILVTATMTYLFLIIGGATTVQFNAGSTSRMNVWSTWVDIWPLFLLLSAGSALGALIWLIICSVIKEKRNFIPFAVASLCLSLLTFFTVAAYFPSA